MAPFLSLCWACNPILVLCHYLISAFPFVCSRPWRSLCYAFLCFSLSPLTLSDFTDSGRQLLFYNMWACCLHMLSSCISVLTCIFTCRRLAFNYTIVVCLFFITWSVCVHVCLHVCVCVCVCTYITQRVLWVYMFACVSTQNLMLWLINVFSAVYGFIGLSSKLSQITACQVFMCFSTLITMINSSYLNTLLCCFGVYSWSVFMCVFLECLCVCVCACKINWGNFVCGIIPQFVYFLPYSANMCNVGQHLLCSYKWWTFTVSLTATFSFAFTLCLIQK